MMKKLAPFRDLITLARGESRFLFYPSGDVFAFTRGDTLINGFRGSPMDGSANNIWLRVHGEGGIKAAYPLLGLRAGGAVEAGQWSLAQSGRAGGIGYRVTFYLAGDGLWCWRVALDGEGATVDLLYGQDIGVADRGMALTNELYTAQYLGHTVFDGPNGYAVCSRQNMPQSGGRFPFLQQGLLEGRCLAYATDGTQFFGLSYRETDEPQALTRGLPSEMYQYEFAYTGLQTEPVALTGTAEFVLYGLFCEDHAEAVRHPMPLEAIRATYGRALAQEEPLSAVPPTRRSAAFGAPYAAGALPAREIAARWPERLLEEAEGAFFTPDGTHVVLRGKELCCERPHGHIMMSGVDEARVNPRVLASTCAMGGQFAAQTVVGNTNLHKLLSAQRGMLQTLKYGGQRLYVRLGGAYRLLTLPSAWAVTPHSARWYYRMPDGDTLRISAHVACGTCDLTLGIQSESNRPYDFLLTSQLVLGETEWEGDIMLDESPRRLRLAPDPARWAASPYPDLHFDVRLPDIPLTVSDDRVFFADGLPRDGTLLTIEARQTASLVIVTHGALTREEDAVPAETTLDGEGVKFAALLDRMTGAFRLDASGEAKREADRLNCAARWYAHNALIHYASPHGLEQPGGAAWGTRDVCQGPFELLLSAGNFTLARAVLLRVFENQSRQTGEWPQWFMFDGYPIFAGDCHGDVVLWPMRCVGAYLEGCGDASILAESVRYADDPEPEPLLSHVRRAASHFTARFLPGTALMSYAGGDWDDTLQPADPAMKVRLVSAWTQALACQAAEGLARTLGDADQAFALEMREISARMRDAFLRHLVVDGEVAGFALLEDDGSFTPMLHPADNRTGIRCRLIPLTRGILAEVVDAEQAQRNLAAIDKYLRCPDGIRLMSRPARYDGGVSALFRRAEQAANVGREIGLQYVHAHIRYAQAMAKLGLGERALDALLQVTPPGLSDCVPNALPRQSNLYFSSSDGAFPDRASFALGFDRLRAGDVPVKGGWRLYSSGPGIFLHALAADVLGIRYAKGGLCVDPALPARLRGLTFRKRCFERTLTFVYEAKAANESGVMLRCCGQPVPAKPCADNRYRAAGVFVDEAAIRALPSDEIVVYCL